MFCLVFFACGGGYYLPCFLYDFAIFAIFLYAFIRVVHFIFLFFFFFGVSFSPFFIFVGFCFFVLNISLILELSMVSDLGSYQVVSDVFWSFVTTFFSGRCLSW